MINMLIFTKRTQIITKTYAYKQYKCVEIMTCLDQFFLSEWFT